MLNLLNADVLNLLQHPQTSFPVLSSQVAVTPRADTDKDMSDWIVSTPSSSKSFDSKG